MFELYRIFWLFYDLARRLWECCDLMCVDEVSCLLGTLATMQWNSSRWAATAPHMPEGSRGPMLIKGVMADQQKAAQPKTTIPQFERVNVFLRAAKF